MNSFEAAVHTNGSEAYVKELNHWVELEKAAIRLIHAVGVLYYDKGVEVILFRKPLLNQDASEIINHHSFARNVSRKSMTVHDSVVLAEAMADLSLAPSRIDLGKLLTQWLEEKNAYPSVSDFLRIKLNSLMGEGAFESKPKDVVLYGFGRIGRLLARELVAQAGKGLQLRLRAIVTRGYSDQDLFKRASLLRSDSIHGHFAGTISEEPENKALLINGHRVFMIDAAAPDNIDYTQFGIEDALVIDNTGAWRDREGLSRHLKSNGVDKVLLTAPGKGDIPNIVYGVNHDAFDPDSDRIWSAASCTTNAVVPVVKVIDAHLGIEHGHIETVHAYTNDQNLLDNYHKGLRRGRSAALNMVITETGAAKAVFKVFPHLKGKLTGNAVRVPVPNGSLAILMLRVQKSVTVEEVNNLMRHEALFGELVEQIEYAYSNDLVSSDIIGNACAAIFDSKATIVSEDGRHLTLYVWYDNEYGYTRQVVRLAKHLAKVRRPTFY